MYSFLEKEAVLGNKYDICLLFGFLYHTSTPVELLRMIKRICKYCLIIDTTLNERDDRSIHIYEENTKWSRASSNKISFTPSFHAVPLMAEAAGFMKTEYIKPIKELEALNPGGDNLDYYFLRDRNVKDFIQVRISKLSKFPRLKPIQIKAANIFNCKVITGKRQAHYISYVDPE
ncbi:MAG: hypothetical protein HQK93_06510 [Nitrospirae bacterium]|nr:hypothetical protein [Nitrospirota bacterium]